MNKKIPEMELSTLLGLARLELETFYGEIDGDERKRDGLHINGHPLVEVIRHHEAQMNTAAGGAHS